MKLTAQQQYQSKLEDSIKPRIEPETASLCVVRICLLCRNGFKSEGAHNRICKKCKESARYREG